MKKLVFLIGDLRIGGAEKMLAYAANVSTGIFDDVTIVTLQDDPGVYQLDPKIKVVELNIPTAHKSKPARSLARCRYLRRALRQLSPDIVIAFVNPTIVYAYFCAPKSAMLVGADRGNPAALPRFNRMISRSIYARCDRLIFQTQAAAGLFSEKIRRKSVVIENPLIIQGKDPGVYTGIRKKTIVSTSRLDKEKNVDVLIKAFAKSQASRDHVLQILGTGSEEKRLRQLSLELGVQDKVEFLGDVIEVMDTIADAGMFVLASRQEGIPNGLIEAMAAGIPCIATNCMAGGTNTLIQNGENGLIVDIDDVEGLTRAIDFYCSDADVCERFGARAAEVRQTLKETAIRQKWIQFYSNINGEVDDDVNAL